MSKQLSMAALTAANTYCDGVKLNGDFNISITGTWVGTITVQRSFDAGTSYGDVEAFTANAEKVSSSFEKGVMYRVGFKTGEFTSGTANVRLSQ